jgi:hypothetical protein
MLKQAEAQRWVCEKCGSSISAPVRWSAVWCPQHKPDRLMTLVEGELPRVVNKRVVRSKPTARKTNMDHVIELLKGVADGKL